MQETMIAGLFLALLMASKKKTARRFGQMTLNLGGQALEYLKTDPKGIVRDVVKVEWMNKHHAVDLGWVLPPWVLPTSDDDRQRFANADRVQDVAIIHDADPARMPLLVHQTSALQGLDEVLAAAQEDGALVEDDGKRMVLDMGEGHMTVAFIRNGKSGRFARFVVRRQD